VQRGVALAGDPSAGCRVDDFRCADVTLECHDETVEAVAAVRGFDHLRQFNDLVGFMNLQPTARVAVAVSRNAVTVDRDCVDRQHLAVVVPTTARLDE
jgi:hypothetical protein